MNLLFTALILLFSHTSDCQINFGGPMGLVCEQCKKLYTKDSSSGYFRIHLGQFPMDRREGGNSLVCELVLFKKASKKLYTETKQKKGRI